jgi:acetaldehyde dehydrogenase/alcohol dehydrogenase
MPAPGYGSYVAPAKYAQMAWVLGLGGRGETAARERLFSRVEGVLGEVGIPRSLREAGVQQDAWAEGLDELRGIAFVDPSGRTNPRMPLLSELGELLEAGSGH